MRNIHTHFRECCPILLLHSYPCRAETVRDKNQEHALQRKFTISIFVSFDISQLIVDVNTALSGVGNRPTCPLDHTNAGFYVCRTAISLTLSHNVCSEAFFNSIIIDFKRFTYVLRSPPNN